MFVFIARHGESFATLDPDLMGRQNPCEIPLTVWGHHQALQIGLAIADRYTSDERLRGRRLRIYTSQHQRIKQTSDAICHVLSSSVVSGRFIDENLRQRNYGIFDGLSRQGKKELDPLTYAKLHSSELRERYETIIPRGESARQVELRIREFLLCLQAEICDDEDILIVNHGPQCRILKAVLTYSDPVQTVEGGEFGTGDLVMVESNEHCVVVHTLLFDERRSSDPKRHKVDAEIPHAKGPEEQKEHSIGRSNELG